VKNKQTLADKTVKFNRYC